MKKKILIVLVAFALFSCLVFSVSAAGTTATTESKSCAKGDTVSISVSVTSTSGVTSGGADIIFDESKLELLGGEWHIPGALMPTIDVAKKKAGFALTTSGTVNGKILTLQFKVLSDAPIGDTDINCNVILKNGQAELPITNNSGKISITCKHDFTKKTLDYPASPASCTSAAKYYYTCNICDAKGTTTFTEGLPTSHSFNKQVTTADYLVSLVTCADTADYYYSCECGTKGTETFTGDASFSHNFTESWLIGKDGHWRGCLDCGKKKDLSSHDGEICSVCSFISEGEHFHSFSDAYSKDENGHWNECACGAKQSLALHTWNSGEVTKVPTLSAEGERKLTCTACGEVKTENVAKLVSAPSSGQSASVVNESEGPNPIIVVIITIGATLLVEAVIYAIIRTAKNKKTPILSEELDNESEDDK